MEDSPEVEVVMAPQETIENPSVETQESRDEMLSRHRKEIAQLQNKEIEMKKAAAKGSKAEQKAKKKQVEEEIAKLSAKLKEKHAEELSSLGYSSTSNGFENDKGNLDTLVKAIAGVSVTTQADNHKPSKSVKRRSKRAQQEAEREQRIKEEQSNIVSDKEVEDELLEKKLAPLGLIINEVKPDGHCMYRAVEDQLAHLSGGSSLYDFQQLRVMVASYMRDHASDFLPFFASENVVEGEAEESVVQRFEKYCREVESTAAWGGQLELGALTHCLKKCIMVFSGNFPDVEMGKEYSKTNDDGAAAPLNSCIKLSYHMHAFGLGEHYNSVVPNL